MRKNITKMTVAVTGGSGFVGTHLIRKLEKLGAHIINLDISAGTDITNWAELRKFGPFDLVYHLAAKSFVPDSYANPRDFYYVNVIGTLNILELCRLFNAKFVFASSYIYGPPQCLPIDERHPVQGFNPYAQSKLVGEQLCEGYHRDFGLPVIIFRPFNIYGPGQDSHFLIPLIIKQARAGSIILKTAKPKRDYIYIDDIVEAYIKCAEYNESAFEIFNIGAGCSYSVQEVVAEVVKHFPYDIPVSYSEESRKNEIMNTVANIAKATDFLGWHPTISISEGISKIISVDAM